MKVRQGFVSNSSSTSFVFIFKGESPENLYDSIRNHYDYFDISFYDYENNCHKCNAEDVINSIKSVLVDEIGEEYQCDNTSIVSIDDFVDNLERELNFLEKDIEEINEDRDSFMINTYMQEIFDYVGKISNIKKAKEKGFNSVLKIDFGDNHGHISGKGIGMAMDYEGRNIYIKKDDLIVFTDQNR